LRVVRMLPAVGEVCPHRLERRHAALDGSKIQVNILECRQQLESGQRIDCQDRQAALQIAVVTLLKIEHEQHHCTISHQFYEIAWSLGKRLIVSLAQCQSLAAGIKTLDEVFLTAQQQQILDAAET